MKILETYVSLSDAPHFTNTVTELVVGAEARLDHCKIQEENTRAIHIAAVQARQDKGSHWTSHSVSTGAQLARHQIQSLFHGENGLLHPQRPLPGARRATGRSPHRGGSRPAALRKP